MNEEVIDLCRTPTVFDSFETCQVMLPTSHHMFLFHYYRFTLLEVYV
jgi:hypothetical protein